MLIIKHGKLGEIKHFTCQHCGCEFLANSADYFIDTFDETINCECPDCKWICTESEDKK